MPTLDEAMQLWPVRTRDEAHKAGAAHYFTGKACKRGHYDQRSVASGVCVACNRLYARKFRDTLVRGYAQFEVACHPEDAEIIKQFVAGINAQRDAKAQALATQSMDAERRALFPALRNAPADYSPPAFEPRTLPVPKP
jgi:hypothetical protein